jgi:plasmid stabilization system protein ParE
LSRWTLAVTATADGQVQAIEAWWQVNRPDAPGLFAREFAEALDRLEAAPFSGAEYAVPRPEGTRRILLPRTRYHAYYTVDESRRVVVVRGVWHASRSRGPELR